MYSRFCEQCCEDRAILVFTTSKRVAMYSEDMRPNIFEIC